MSVQAFLSPRAEVVEEVIIVESAPNKQTSKTPKESHPMRQGGRLRELFMLIKRQKDHESPSSTPKIIVGLKAKIPASLSRS